MNVKNFLFIILFSGTTFAQKQRNVLFIFVDDLAFDCVAAHGNTQVKTPNIDQLSQSGTHFTAAYNSGAFMDAICMASRTMMMTGKQIWGASEVWTGTSTSLKKSQDSKTVSDARSKGEKKKKRKKKGKGGHGAHKPNITSLKNYQSQGKMWAAIMQSAGYETYFAGKWHTGPKEIVDAGWKNTRHIRTGMPKTLPARYRRKFIEDQKDTWSPFNTNIGGYWEGGKHWSEVVVDDGIAFLNETKNSDKPFLITLAFNAPHDPRQAPKEFQEMYPYDQIEVPQNFLTKYPFNNGALRVRDEKLAPFPRTPYAVKVNRSEYYALITHLDEQIGKVLHHLKATGQDKNTVILFTSDHGLAVGHHGLIGKQSMYEHSVRVPWIIAGRGIPKAKKVATPIYLQDVMATAIDIAGIEKPKHIDFHSVLPYLKKEGNLKKPIYGAYKNFQRMVTNQDFKLIVYPHIKKQLLYNLRNDPLEMKDLSNDSSYSKDLAKMKNLLKEEMQKMNDPLSVNAIQF